MRFFVEPHQIFADKIEIGKEDAKHLAVLRYSVGDEISVADGTGKIYKCCVTNMSRDGAAAEILLSEDAETETGVKITLFQALPKADKMELIIQKAVELGVHEIVPVITRRTVVDLSGKEAKKTERFRKISESAAKQSLRGIIPHVSEPVRLADAIEKMQSLDASCIAYENQEGRGLADIFSGDIATAGVFIGPEGGFTGDEVQLCAENGILPVSLGKRILRTETAGFTAIIGILLIRGEL